MFSTTLFATEAHNIAEMFSKAKASGNLQYYYIQTDKNKAYTNQPNTSANANSIGGDLSYETARFHGLKSKITFLTTNGFLINSDVAKVDTSILGRNNGVYYGDADRAKDSFSILGEAYLSYAYKGLDLSYGRKILKNPLMNAKRVRLLPSSFEGGFADYSINKNSTIGFAYIGRFKQRTSDRFVNVVQHALGANTKAITGSNRGSVFYGYANYKNKNLKAKIYNYYAANFMNSLYLDTTFSQTLSGINLAYTAQFINQKSIGNAQTNLQKTNSATGGKSISSNALALKVKAKVDESTLFVAYSKVFRDKAKHDSLVLPWDGTPLLTNMITSNNLFQSNYGKGLQSDSVYIGGSQGIKLGYTQGFDFTGAKGFSTTLTYLNTSNSRAGFTHDQHDYNIVLGYKSAKAFSLKLKGIWVTDNTSADAQGVVKQLKQLTQYRVIANYKF